MVNEREAQHYHAAPYVTEVISRSGHTHSWVARQAGISRQFLYLLLRDRKACSSDTARALCEVLRMPSYALFIDHEGNPARFTTRRTRKKST